jgi:alpha-mannosidase
LGWVALCGLAALAGQPAAGGNDVYVIPFSHLDLFWAGSREECLSRGNFIIAQAIRIAAQHPEFRFLLEDEVFIADYVEAHRGAPELEELKRLVKAGRIEIGPKWAGILQNLPRGESHVRNQLYGKLYAREVFGVDPQVAHLGDLPGYTSQFPQILAKSDTPFMVQTRMGPPDCSLFRWRSPDGSTALVWNAIKGYSWGTFLTSKTMSEEQKQQRIHKDVADLRKNYQGPIFMHWGSDLFAPGEQLVDIVAQQNRRLAPLGLRFATPEEFFRMASKVPGTPERSGEIPSSWANIISSMSHLWPSAMRGADTLLLAERFAAINLALGYADYPQAEFDRLWKLSLQSMDHNNFGQGGNLGDARKLEYAEEVIRHSGQILRDMLRNIAERVRSPVARNTSIVVFNPLNWNRDDVVRTHVSVYGEVGPGEVGDYPKAMRLVDETGASVPFQVEQSYGTVSRAFEIVFVAREVPSLGYKTYFLTPAGQAESFANVCALKLDNPDPAKPKRVFGVDELESAYYRLTVDRATGRITVFDKQWGRVAVKDVEIVGTEMRGGDSLSKEPKSGRIVPNVVSRVEVEENNPVRTVVCLEGDVGGVAITQRVFLHRGVKRIDLENTVDWKQNRFLKIEQLFPYEDPQAQIRYGVPFGSVAGTDILPNSGPRAGDEVPYDEWKTWRQIQDWIFAGTAEGGITVAADRQLMILGDGVIRAGMLRGAYSYLGINRGSKAVLLQVPPVGTYVFRYSLSSGQGDWTAAKSYRLGMGFSTPLVPVTSVDGLSSKSLPPSRSFCSLAADNLVVSAVKKAQRDGAIVLRVFEMEGTRAQTPIEFRGRKSVFRTANLLEEGGRSGDQEVLRVNPYEISTVRLSIK